MAGLKVLLEFNQSVEQPFDMQMEALSSASAAERLSLEVMSALPGLGIELDGDGAPIPMFVQQSDVSIEAETFSLEMNAAADALERRPAVSATSVVVPAEISRARLSELEERPDVTVWPNSELTLFNEDEDLELEEWASLSAMGGVDCRPFRPGVQMSRIRKRLGVGAIWRDGFAGQNIIVGIIDEGVNGQTYPVIGGFSRPGSGRQPGTAPITSHGSMCAADVLLAAPWARLYDYPFLGVPNSGGALQMFQAVLNQRAINGTPHITNNSYGFVGVPDRGTNPRHEVHDINHPLHRKVREVVLAGVTCFFAAGNCGQNCPSGVCHPSGIGPGKSIHASNSLSEVITVAAVNSQHQRIGYSSQGPGMFHAAKPDIASYSHFFGNFGPNRPGGMAQPFDNGTSAATPVAAGAAAALLSAFPNLTPARMKSILIRSAIDLGSIVGFDRDYGAGVINLAAAYQMLKRRPMAAIGFSDDELVAETIRQPQPMPPQG